MDHADLEIIHALENTRVVREPRQTLASFGTTVLRYHLVTEPAYASATQTGPEAVVREGTVTAQRPAIVTPAYLLNLEGFGAEAKRSLEYLGKLHGMDSPGLMYTYKNDPVGLEIVGGTPYSVAARIVEDLDRSGKNLSVVIIGVDTLWDVSLMKFIYEFTAASFHDNVEEMQHRGLLAPDPAVGIPRGAMQGIEALFHAVEAGQADPIVLKAELDRWDLFRRYEDRFLSLFRQRHR